MYNTADPRYVVSSPKTGFFRDFRFFPSVHFPSVHGSTGEAFPALGRLVGSGAEVASAGRAYSFATGSKAVILTGVEAQRDRFLNLMGGRPAVIHLATHVLFPPNRRDQAFIAFSLGTEGTAKYLATSDVAMLSVPGARVAMTGCETASGDARAGVGLIGLSRAWLMAGAASVIATEWPVRDSAGGLFSSFYEHLANMRASQALRLSQIDMIRSGAWRASPAYWAAYVITGAER